MPYSLTPSKTRGLVALVAALALLLAGSFGVDAQAAISKSQQSAKATGQASFFCFAWNCSSKVRTTTAYSGSTLKTTWRLAHPHHMMWHGNCTTVANMLITVSSTGSVVSRLLSCH